MSTKRKHPPKKNELAERELEFDLGELLNEPLDDSDQIGEMATALNCFLTTATELTKLVCEKDQSIQNKEAIFQTFQEALQISMSSMENFTPN